VANIFTVPKVEYLAKGPVEYRSVTVPRYLLRLASGKSLIRCSRIICRDELTKSSVELAATAEPLTTYRRAVTNIISPATAVVILLRHNIFIVYARSGME